MTCRPDHLVLGISSESIWGGGLKQADALLERIRSRAGAIGITQAAHAVPAALKAYGVKRRIALVTPYFPVAEKHLRTYVQEIGYEAVRMEHLCCKSPVLIAHTTEKQLRDAMRAVDGDDVEAIVQFGANLPNARLAGEAERWLEKPVICINTVTYWHALRSTGIQDKVYGFGRLLSEF
jgi:maleate isomerase